MRPSADSVVQIQFAPFGLAHALADSVLHVPLNQREFAWEAEDVTQLLDDLYRAFIDGEPMYFLGAVVLTRASTSAPWQVSDGQQRLATTAITIAAIRDYLIELGEQDAANKYQEKYLLEYNVRQKAPSPRLILNYQDREYFTNTILSPPSKQKKHAGKSYSSHDRLKKAAEVARDHTRRITVQYPEDERAERLHDWVEYLHHSAVVILIKVPDTVGNAFKMFGTLNSRGVDASQVDIIKNLLFEKAQSRLDEMHTRWMTMNSNIEDVGDDGLLLTFIRQYWISIHGPTMKDDLGKRVEAVVKSERQAVDLISSFESASVDYVALLLPRSHPKWVGLSKDGRDCLHTITRDLKAIQIRPLLLAIARNFQPKEAESAFESCLSWTVRFLIAGGGGGGVLERHFGHRAMEVSKKEITTAKKLSERMADVIPQDDVFKSSFAVASVRQANLARYYLRALDIYLKGGESKPQLIPTDDASVVNLEHVLPVTPTKGWNVSANDAAAYYRRLGNMCLLGAVDNVRIGNGPFADKKPVYKGSAFKLTKEIASYRKWGPEEIVRQQERMAELAPKVWPL